MKNTYIVTCLFLISSVFVYSQKSGYVFLCEDDNVFHKDLNCDDLRFCDEIAKELRNDAIKKGAKFCSLEYNPQSVFVCTGASSKRYHYNSTCIGLEKCNSDILKVSKEDAVKHGRTLCGYEMK